MVATSEMEMERLLIRDTLLGRGQNLLVINSPSPTKHNAATHAGNGQQGQQGQHTIRIAEVKVVDAGATRAIRAPLRLYSLYSNTKPVGSKDAYGW